MPKIEANLPREVEDRAAALQRLLGCSRSGLVIQAINILAREYQCFFSPNKYLETEETVEDNLC